MLRVNRTFLFVYNLLVALAFLLRYVMVGPILFNQVWCYWMVLVAMALVLSLLNYVTFCHPTPLEIVAYHVNLIMRHPIDQGEDEEYDARNKLYLSERFIESSNYKFFYYEELAIGEQTFNKASIIIKTMDQQYIRFNMIKETDYSLLAFLYEWEIDDIDYSDQTTFERMVKGQ